jgi:curved DNA-binding protein CbpA
MNYYDELGVSRDAPERELRQAYKVLVRLLHPDTQTEDDLRLAAERQLRRLNQMLAVLLNADSRRAYDLSLEQGRSQRSVGMPNRPVTSRGEREPGVSAVPNEVSQVARFALRYWALILIAAVIVGAVALSTILRGSSEPETGLQDAGTQRPSYQRVEAAAAPQVRPSRPSIPDPSAQNRSRPAPAFGAPGAGVLERSVIPEEPPIAPPAVQALKAVPVQAGDSPESLARTEAQAPQGPAQSRLSPAAPQTPLFAGNWLYTSDLPAQRENDGYQAIYVELMLSEKDGTLSGNYRARYIVPDKAISPQVSFHLEGPAGSNKETHLGWSAANGTRGEAVMILGASGVMNFRWWSTDLAGQSGLTSGTAKLVRQRTP